MTKSVILVHWPAMIAATIVGVSGSLSCGAPQPPPAAPTPVEPQQPIATTDRPANTSPPPEVFPPAVDEAATPAPTPEPPPPRCAEGTTLVPGGQFTRAGTKQPATVPDLCIDTRETTATEYAECVQASHCTEAGLDCAPQATYKNPEKQNHPIVCVEFQQAHAYCEYRKKRLPTLEEWEWAARGGEEARKYPWGDEAPKDQLCWTGHEKRTQTCEVGSFPNGDTRHGLKDMAGNVLEFTTTPQDAHSQVRIARGGSWRAGAPELVRNARVGGFGLSYRCGFLGIRCVSEAPPESSIPNQGARD